MKHKGNNIIYITQRNKELYEAYLQELADAAIVRKRDIYRRVVLRPCSRYWISEERARDMINMIDRGIPIDKIATGHRCYKSKTENTIYRDMLLSLYDVFCRVRDQNPDMSRFEQVCIACSTPAPQFFITPCSAQKFILQQKRCNRIMQRLRMHASHIRPHKK